MKKLRILLIILTCAIRLGYAQPTENLPEGLQVPGKVIASERYSDATGENLVLLTSTGNYYDQLRSHDADGYLWNNGREASLYAFRYQMINGVPELKWQLEEHTLDCADDIETSFYKEAFHLTDLDKDGIKEVWMMYRKGCMDGPGPQEMHLVMMEGETRQAMHGRTRYRSPNGTIRGGEYRFESGFLKGPSDFREYGKRMWAMPD